MEPSRLGGILANQLRDFDSVRDFFTSGTVVAATDLLFALLFIAVLFMIAGPLAWIPIVILPVIIGVGLLIQQPLDRATRRLQAESAARHSVLVEALASMETVRAIGAEPRMQTAWERSIAATARSSEDVHFWASMALTPSNVYGHLNGKVERISADTIADEKSPNKEEKAETFYRVMVRTDTNHLGSAEHPLPIIPGMVATVAVLTGHKTVLDYLIKPARLLREEAFGLWVDGWRTEAAVNFGPSRAVACTVTHE